MKLLVKQKVLKKIEPKKASMPENCIKNFGWTTNPRETYPCRLFVVPPSRPLLVFLFVLVVLRARHVDAHRSLAQGRTKHRPARPSACNVEDAWARCDTARNQRTDGAARLCITVRLGWREWTTVEAGLVEQYTPINCQSNFSPCKELHSLGLFPPARTI